MREIVLINVTGKDKPGLTASLTNILAQYKVSILDIGQAVIHDYLSLGILFEMPVEHASSSILKDLLFEAHKLDIQIRFSAIEADSYENWSSHEGQQRRIITLLGRKLTGGQLAQVTKTIADNNLNIDVITRLSGRISPNDRAATSKTCVQFNVSGNLDEPSKLRGRLLNISNQTGIDISFHVDDIFKHARRLVVFDMDSTLIQGEVINQLAHAHGAGTKVAEITALAMQGELDFKESLIRRTALLQGLDEKILSETADNLVLTEGAENLTDTLKRLGYKIGIISGGFDYFGRYLQAKLNLDYVFANELEISGGRLTGKIKGDIIDGPKKAEILKTIAMVENINLQQTIAVGDGANDLPMINIAGLGVAFHAKPMVKQNAKQAISNVGLDGLLYLMGISEREIRQR